MKAQKFAFICLILFFCISVVSATELDVVREAGKEYAKFREKLMIDGPFYVEDRPYYIVDYMFKEDVKGSLVYDLTYRQFVTDKEIMRKAFATRDLRSLTMWDPLFYAIGDSSKIPLAAKYETQNVRNFAAFSTITDEERDLLETFLEDYEKLARSIAETSELTNSILYPEGGVKFAYSRSPPNILIEIDESKARGGFSYEAFAQLIDAYDRVYSNYQDLIFDLKSFAGGLEEYPPGAVIREKWEVEMTKEGLLQEINLVDQNGQALNNEIGLRRDILSYPYETQIKDAEERLGKKRGICGPTSILILTLVSLLVLSYFRRRPPKPPFFIPLFLTTAILLWVATPVLSQGSTFEVPTAEELISQKISDVDKVPIEILAEGIDEGTARDLLRGFRLIMEGEGVYVRGPYYYYGRPNYLFDIVKDGESTGKGFLVDASALRLVASQRMAFQLLKTRFLADMIERKPLYRDVDAKAIAKEAEGAEPPLGVFLTNLTENIEAGKKFEEDLITRPDFETVMNLTKIYVQGYITLQNIERAAPSSDARAVTHGFLNEKVWLEAYARTMMGLSADEYLEGRRAQYTGRTLNRLPLMATLSAMGMSPSKAQVVHDLSSDLIYDNIFLWRLGKVKDPNLFARLAFKEGTFTLPKVLNQTSEGG